MSAASESHSSANGASLRRRLSIASNIRAIPVSAWIVGLLLASFAAVANFQLWRWLHPPVAAPDVTAPIGGLAYNAFRRWDNPFDRRFPSAEEVDEDLKLLAQVTQRIRTYSSSEFPELPALADKHGLRMAAGVWLDGRPANNRREIEAVKLAVREHRSIERVIAGNETLLHGLLTPQQLYAYLDELRRTVRVPVSTAEPWHVWLSHPELARHVDYLTVHLLPYWEGVPAEAAVDYALTRFEELRRAFPGKRIVIGEIGWPSAGDRREGAVASPLLQAQFIRGFLASPMARGLDYYLMEAVDQPWKLANEGRVGAYWGIHDAARVAKFPLTGPLESSPGWSQRALLASGLAFLPILWFGAAFARMRLASRVFFAALIQASVALGVWLAALPLDHYLRPVDWAALALLFPALAAMIAILLAHGFEFAELFWDRNLRRAFGPKPLAAGAPQPKVSIHLAACNEPPEMVIATLDSLAALEYDNLEVLVIDNNTRDEALWRPVQAHVERLGPRFRFFHLPKWPGFKAGALNFGLSQTAPDAEIVGVVDADYVVRPDWLKSLMGHFDDPRVAVVQSPQAHRGWRGNLFRRMMNWEYEGFFRIGMRHRNERDAIIQHGTMTLIRARALREHGQWAEWTICEDAELGLRLMQAGYQTVYVDRVMGRGLTPDGFTAFAKQRRRWALGAMQILRGHWAALTRSGRLSSGQRYHFVAGWLGWLGDALHLVFALAAMLWTVGMLLAPHLFSLPIALFLAPLAAFVAVRMLFGPLLYWRRVRCSIPDIAGAAIAGMALSHAIARGVFAGLTERASVFEITRKGSASRAAGWLGAVREEGALLGGLLVCAVGMMAARGYGHPEAMAWVAVLMLQAIPYAATLACAVVSASPWQRLRGLPRTRPAPRAEPSMVPGAARPIPNLVERRRAVTVRSG